MSSSYETRSKSQTARAHAANEGSETTKPLEAIEEADTATGGRIESDTEMPRGIAEYDASDEDIVMTEGNEEDAMLADLDKQLAEAEKGLQERERQRATLERGRDKNRSKAVQAKIAELEELKKKKEEADRQFYRAEQEHNEIAEYLSIRDEHATKRQRSNHRGDSVTRGRYGDDSPEPSRRRSRSRERHLFKPKFHLPPLDKFKGESLLEAQAFIASAERHQRLTPQNFPDDQVLIDYCVLHLSTKPERLWSEFENSGRGRDITWPEFCKFLTGTVQDEENRYLSTHVKLGRLRQPADMSLDDFMIELGMYENELNITDKQWKWHNLYSKMHPSIRDELAKQGKPPRDREDLLSIARRIENSFNLNRERNPRDKGKEIPTKPHRFEGRTYPDRGPRRDEKRDHRRGLERSDGSSRNRGISDTNRTPVGGGTKTDECYHCKKPGHIMDHCPEVTCFRCQKKGHTTRSCTSSETIPKQPGNDRARS